MSSKDLIYHCKDLDFFYTLDETKIHALTKLSLDIPRGDFICIQGPSGSGKSTFLSLLGLIEKVQQGTLLFNGNDLSQLKESEKNTLRRHDLAFVFQMFNLIPILTAYENVEYFLIKQNVPIAERKQRVEQALTTVGLWEHRMKKPMQMSGGQRQRVAIARAVVKNPQVIIADEPTASLDQKTGHEIMDLFHKLNRERGVTLIVASHDPMVAERVKRKIILRDGSIAEDILC